MTIGEIAEVEKGASLWRDGLRRLAKNRLAVAGLIVIVCAVFACALTPLIAPYSYEEQDLTLRAVGPCAKHWLGTDPLGRDLLTRILYGGRISLLVGFAATAVSLSVGVFYGAISGFAGGRVDSIMMRAVDVIYTLPFTIFVIILMVFLGRSLVLLFMAIGAVQWLTMARIVRDRVLALRNSAFIEAAIVLGFSRTRIVARHIVPNILGPAIVYATLTIPSVMLLEAFLSFLGLGVQAPMSSWGVLINEGANCMEEYPWMLLFPSLALSATLFSLNFLGDGMRDAFDPKSSKD
jgi:oligopeptide transport system permease protein